MKEFKATTIKISQETRELINAALPIMLIKHKIKPTVDNVVNLAVKNYLELTEEDKKENGIKDGNTE